MSNDTQQQTSHTPGPWYVDDDQTVRECESGGWVAKIPTREDIDGKPCDNETRANARLIATAPRMLEALRELDDLCPRMSDDDPIAPAVRDALRRARAIIATATGQGGEGAL